MTIYREAEVDVNVSEILKELNDEEKKEALKILAPKGIAIPTKADGLMTYLKNASGSEIEYLKMTLDDRSKEILRTIIN